MFNIQTDLGEIRFSPNVIKKIVNDAIAGSNGKVNLYNFKGMLDAVSSHGDNTSLIIEETEDGLDVTLYVVVKFGTSISSEGNRITREVRENIENVLGVPPHLVRLVVTGVESKEIARRNIEFYS